MSRNTFVFLLVLLAIYFFVLAFFGFVDALVCYRGFDSLLFAFVAGSLILLYVDVLDPKRFVINKLTSMVNDGFASLGNAMIAKGDVAKRAVTTPVRTRVQDPHQIYVPSPEQPYQIPPHRQQRPPEPTHYGFGNPGFEQQVFEQQCRPTQHTQQPKPPPPKDEMLFPILGF